MEYPYADLEYSEDGTPRVVRESSSAVLLRTDDEVIVPEERREVQVTYVCPRTGREAVVRGWATLPPIVRTADVRRGPDGLPARRPLVGDPPALLPWQRFDGAPTYVIRPGEVEKVWKIEAVPLDDWRRSLVSAVEDEAVRRLGELVPAYRRLIAVDDGAARAAAGLRELVSAATAAIYDATTHASALEAADGARALIREFEP